MKQAESMAIEPQMLFRGYAVVAIIGGVLLTGWGPMWLPADMHGVPWLQAALTRLVGAVAIAAGCCAAQFAKVEDPVACRNGVLWFGVAHAVVGVAAWAQQRTILDSEVMSAAVACIGYVTLLLLLFWFFPGLPEHPQGLMSLFSASGGESTATLRSRYENEIREAAGQEERNRLARDLHDSIKQQIFVIQTAAATAQARFEADARGAQGAIEQVREAARAALTELEVMLSQLRAEPLGKQGLEQAIRKECEALGFRTGARVECSIGELPPNEWMAPGMPRAMLRIVQEALANVGRHARATQVEVSLDSGPGSLELKVVDDGRGFDPGTTRQGMGLGNMRERAAEFGGTLEVLSQAGGRGTTVRISVPVEEWKNPRVYLRQGVALAALALVCTGMAFYRGMGGISAIAVITGVRALRNFSAYSRVRSARS